MGGSVMDLPDRAEDHRRGAPDRPAHQVPGAVSGHISRRAAVRLAQSPSGLVVMSQKVSTLESAYGAGSNS